MSWVEDTPEENTFGGASLPVVEIVYIKKNEAGAYDVEKQTFDVSGDMTVKELARAIIERTGYRNISLKGDGQLLTPAADANKMISNFSKIEVTVAVTAG